jgi:predicted ester cyclase
MAQDHDKSLARRSLMMWASDSRDMAEEIFAKTYVNHQESDAQGNPAVLDLAAWKGLVAENHRAFSSFRVEILMQVAEGDLVATRWRFTAIQTGVYMGHPPTQREATWTGVQIDRVAHGRIAESWVDWDKYRLFKTLGFLT